MKGSSLLLVALSILVSTGLGHTCGTTGHRCEYQLCCDGWFCRNDGTGLLVCKPIVARNEPLP